MLRPWIWKRAVLIVLLLAVLGSGGSTTSRTQGADELGTLHAQVQKLYEEGKYAEATVIAKRSLALAEKLYGPDHPEIVTPLDDTASLYGKQGRYTDAEQLYEQSLATREKALGPDHPDVGSSLDNLGMLYYRQGRYAAAESLIKRSLTIREKALDPGHPDVGQSLNSLAEVYLAQGRAAEAEPLYKRSLAIREKALGPNHPDVAQSLNNLALLFSEEDRYFEAEPIYKRSLAIREKALGADHPDVAQSLNNLALLYAGHGRYFEAEPIYKRSLAIWEKALGPDHPEVSASLNNMAVLYIDQGRYGEAERLYKRSLAIRVKALGPDHPDIGQSLNGLAEVYREQGRGAEAEPLYKRSLAVWEKALGPNHPKVAFPLSNLGALYQDQGRYDDAERLYKRSLAIREKVLGPNHPDFAQSLFNLAVLYKVQRRYAESEVLYKRSLAVREKALGPRHSSVGNTLNALAAMYDEQGRRTEAEPLFKRALAVSETALGADHPDVAAPLNNLAVLYGNSGRYAKAEPLYKRALAITEKALGPDHFLVALALNNLAALSSVQRDWVRAADYWRRSTSVLVRRMRRGNDDVGQAVAGMGAADGARAEFHNLVKVVYRLALGERTANASLSREMFQTAQWARGSQAAASLAQMAARSAKGKPALAAIVRQRQDLVAEWRMRDQGRTAAVSQAPDKRDRDAEGVNAARLATIDEMLREIDKRLIAEFPEYASLSHPQPLSIEDVQSALSADEALVLFLDTSETMTPEETFIWVVTKTAMRWLRSELGTPSLAREVGALRCGLDYEGSWAPKDSLCAGLLNTNYSAADDQSEKPLPFSPARAHALYKALLGQVEDLIKGKHLLVVPSGSLTQLPFQVLVTINPETPTLDQVDFRKVAWLARSNAITVLPAVSSLKALRQQSNARRATKPFLGVGNPLLDGPDSGYAALKQASLQKQSCAGLTKAQVADRRARGGVKPFVQRGGVARVADLRLIAPLPETADELCDVAKAVGAAEVDVLLGARASEGEIKRLSESGALQTYRIVHFATHGALAGEFSGSAEPGLLLTPPSEGTEADDGYLSASEIAGLKLDADWVILSACNTAAGNAKSAEPLSGLARAFFYAGARALLVSHWPVDSVATVALIKGASAELKGDPKLGRSEALRRSMMALIEKGSNSQAHPALWAPFVIVGEGGAGR